MHLYVFDYFIHGNIIDRRSSKLSFITHQQVILRVVSNVYLFTLNLKYSPQLQLCAAFLGLKLFIFPVVSSCCRAVVMVQVVIFTGGDHNIGIISNVLPGSLRIFIPKSLLAIHSAVLKTFLSKPKLCQPSARASGKSLSQRH